MDKGQKQTLIPKIVCLLLSIGLWLYITNVENPTRSAEVKNIPVELVNVESLKESKLSIVDGQNFKVDLKVEGTSSEVINIKKDKFKIVADMSTYALKEGDNTIPAQIIAYPENISVKNNGYLGIKVRLEKYETKEIALTSSVKLSFKDHIYEKGQTISPQKITVSGGKSKIEKISRAVLIGEEKNISNNITNTYDIKFLNANGEKIEGVESNEKKGKLSIEVSKGKTVPIKANVIGNVARGYKLENVELQMYYVKVTGDDKALDSLKEIYTEPIDVSNLTEGKDISVKLNLPEGIEVKETSDNVNVKISIMKEAIQSSTIPCNVQYINLPEGFTLKSSTEATQVTIEGLKQELDNINSSDIQVTMDLSQVNSEGTFSYTPVVNISENTGVSISNVEDITVTIVAEEKNNT